ncbi:MAG: ABC transporter permease, partial [Gammaproteobacteria bacterium]|nr:ABC transporter permease [Gammaproteobacteria bacterium]
MLRISLIFAAIAIACLGFADLEITTVDPWGEMARLWLGLLTPDFFATEQLWEALLNTLAFALLGVALANVFGFALALIFHLRITRMACAFVRSIHELFWALLFLQLFGLHPVTGVLAIAIPYSGIVAKVYAEILEEADPLPLEVLPAGSGLVSRFFYARLPEAWAHLGTYSLYRLECGLRSSAILGFIGLPTLGFHLESAFSQGHYSEVSALLLLFYLVIATMPWWMRRTMIPFYLVGAVLVLPGGDVQIYFENVVRFFTQDIVPHPIRASTDLDGTALQGLADWAGALMVQQALPGVWNTVLVTMIALVGSGVVALTVFP